MAAAAGTKANRDTHNPGVQAPSRWRHPQVRAGEAREERGYGWQPPDASLLIATSASPSSARCQFLSKP